MGAAVEAGADIVEIGVPYSDPGMDGPVIQQAVDVAVRAGVGMRDVLRAVEAVAAAGAVPVVMSYWNPIERYGVQRFATDLAAAGGAGAITPDLIPDEAGDVARRRPRPPTSTASSSSRRRPPRPGCARRPPPAAASSTPPPPWASPARGPPSATPPRSWSPAPGRPRPDLAVCVGLGVSDGAQAAEVAAFADGVIVGSAYVRELLEGRGRRRRPGADRGPRREASRLRAHDVLAAIPSPTQGVWELGPLPHPRLRAVHRRRHRRRRLAHREALGGPRRSARRRARHRRLGGAVRHHRRPALPRDLQPPPVLRRGRRPAAGLRHLGGRPRHLGRDRPGRGRRVDRLPPARHPAAGLRRRRRTRPAGRAGDRPAGQLVQQRAVRRPDRPAVGAAHLRVERRPGGRSAPTASRSCSGSSTRRSSTSCCGTSPPPPSSSGPTAGSGSATAGPSRSTSPPTAPAGCGSSCCAPTRPRRSSACGSTSSPRSSSACWPWPTSSGSAAARGRSSTGAPTGRRPSGRRLPAADGDAAGTVGGRIPPPDPD